MPSGFGPKWQQLWCIVRALDTPPGSIWLVSQPEKIDVYHHHQTIFHQRWERLFLQKENFLECSAECLLTFFVSTGKGGSARSLICFLKFFSVSRCVKIRWKCRIINEIYIITYYIKIKLDLCLIRWRFFWKWDFSWNFSTPWLCYWSDAVWDEEDPLHEWKWSEAGRKHQRRIIGKRFPSTASTNRNCACRFCRQ